MDTFYLFVCLFQPFSSTSSRWDKTLKVYHSQKGENLFKPSLLYWNQNKSVLNHFQQYWCWVKIHFQLFTNNWFFITLRSMFHLLLAHVTQETRWIVMKEKIEEIKKISRVGFHQVFKYKENYNFHSLVTDKLIQQFTQWQWGHSKSMSPA